MLEQSKLQDNILNTCRQEKMVVTVVLTNGFQIRGTINGFDSFVVLLFSEGKQMMIYKHAISTVVPSHILKIQGDVK